MKKCLFLLLLPVLVFASTLHAQKQNRCEEPMPHYKEGTYYSCHKNGMTAIVMVYKHNLKHGEWRYYDENGELTETVNFEKNKKHGQRLVYYPGGKINIRENWFEDGLKGVREVFYESGALRERSYYAGEVNPYGVYISALQDSLIGWHPNGSLLEVQLYDHGKQLGFSKRYFPNGVVQQEKTETREEERTVTRIVRKAANGVVYERIRSDDYGKKHRLVYDTLTGVCVLSEGEYLWHKHGVFKAWDNTGKLLNEVVWIFGNNVRETDFTAKPLPQWKRVIGEEDIHFRLIDLPVTITGVVVDGNYKVNSIRTGKNKNLVKNGDAYFSNVAILLPDLESALGDTLHWSVHEIRPYIAINSIFLSPLTVEKRKDPFLWGSAYWSEGKIENGMKEGPWKEGCPVVFYEEYTRRLRATRDTPEELLASGNYHAGKKEGHWEYKIGSYIFEGNFVNGKQEGFWQTRKAIYPGTEDELYEKFKKVYEREIEFKSGLPEQFVSGWYKNGLPDSLWTLEYDNPYHESEKKTYRFRNGKFLGPDGEWYPNGNRKYVYKKTNGITVLDTAFAPDGRAISPKLYLYADTIRKLRPVYLDEKNIQITMHNLPSNWFCSIVNGKPDGDFFCWNSIGNVIAAGRFNAGKPDGHWWEINYTGDTVTSIYYKDGELNGPFFYSKNNEEVRGSSVNGKKTGIWETEIFKNGVYQKEEFRNDSVFLLEWRSRRTTDSVQYGNGIRVSWFSHNVSHKPAPPEIRKREYFCNGQCVHAITYYRSGNTESDVYFTPLGDSVLEMYTGRAGNISSGNGFLLDTRFPPDTFVYRNGRLTEKRLPELAKYPETRIVYLPEIIPDPMPGQITRTAVREYGTTFRVTDEILLPPGSGTVNYYFDLAYGEFRPAPNFTQPDSCGNLFCYTNLKPDAQGKIAIHYYVVRNDSEYQNLRGDLTSLFRAAAFAGPSPDKNAAAATFDGKMLRVYLNENR